MSERGAEPLSNVRGSFLPVHQKAGLLFRASSSRLCDGHKSGDSSRPRSARTRPGT